MRVKEIGRASLPNEVALQLFYSEERGYFLYLPRQRAIPWEVEFDRNPYLEFNNFLVADIHTHGYGSAYFSGVDDKDEMGFRIFMVMGRLGTDRPELLMRAGANGSFLNLNIKDYFELSDEVVSIEKGGVYYGN